MSKEINIEAIEKCWGIELNVETNNIKLSHDLDKVESVSLSDSFLEVSRTLFKYGNTKNDLEFAKNVFDLLDLNYDDIVELTNHLENNL